MRRSGKSKVQFIDPEGPIKRLVAKIEEAASRYKTLHDLWEDDYQYYTGEKQDRSEFLPLHLRSDWVTTNFIGPSMDQYLATLMQEDAAWFVVADEEEQDDYARQATTYLRAYEKVRDVAAARSAWMLSALTMRTGVMKVWWDRTLPGGGDVALEAMDPRNVLIDPDARRLEDAEFVALRHTYSLSKLQNLFPDAFGGAYSDEVAPDSIDMEGLDFAGATDAEIQDLDDTLEDTTGDSRRVRVWEVYHEFGKKRTIYSGSRILSDTRTNPTPDQQYPIVLAAMHPTLSSPWGRGIIDQMKGMQDAFNKLRTRVLIWARYVANPTIWTDDPGAQDGFDSNPGAVNAAKTPGAKADYMRPPDMPSIVSTLLQSLPSDMDVASGVPEIMRGIRPEGTNSGISLEILHQAAQIRITGPLRSWSIQWGRIGTLVLKLMQKHYAKDRSLATFDGGEVKRANLPVGALSAVADQSGKPLEDPQPYGYRVVVQAEGALPLSPAAIAELALQLVNMQQIDTPALLDAVKWPNRQAVLERQQAVMQAQMQGQLAGAQYADQQMAQQQAMQGMDIQQQAAMMQAQQGEQQAMEAGAMMGGLTMEGLNGLAEEIKTFLTEQELALVSAVIEGQADMSALEPLVERLQTDQLEKVAMFIQGVKEIQAQQGQPA